MNIDKVDIRKIVLSNKNHIVRKVYINVVLDTYIKVMPFHQHYE